MYEPFFGLSEAPFSLTPDPRFLWPSETHQEGLACLYYGISRRKGFVLLTGEVGAGKTLLLRAVLGRIPETTLTALVTNTAGLSANELLQLASSQLGVREPGRSKADQLIALQPFLLERLEAGLNTVLIVDEAQNLSRAALEEIRLLSNFETDREKLLQIVLTGQPELREKLDDPSLRQLRQRIALEHHVEPLQPEEVHPYLAHRLETAGGRFDEVFASDVEPIFHSFSAGCPRLLNLLADRTLLAAYSKHMRPVPPELVERKAKEMSGQAGRHARASWNPPDG
jgi:general secretion pathway protein A